MCGFNHKEIEQAFGWLDLSFFLDWFARPAIAEAKCGKQITENRAMLFLKRAIRLHIVREGPFH